MVIFLPVKRRQKAREVKKRIQEYETAEPTRSSPDRAAKGKSCHFAALTVVTSGYYGLNWSITKSLSAIQMPNETQGNV